MAATEPRFGQIAVRGTALTGASQVLKIAIRTVQIVVLARLLLPEDFGLVAAVSPIIAFVALFQNLGLQQAVVQRKEITHRQLNHMFWVMALVGLLSALAIALLSPAIAHFYGDPRVTGITIAAGCQLLLGSLTALPLGLINRQMRFAQLALNEIIGSVTLFVATIGSAYLGMGYWSLLIGSGASSFVMLITAWVAARWWPSRLDLRIDRDIFSFGANLTGANLFNFLSRNIGSVLIGRYSGVEQLGYYDRGHNLLLFPLHNIVTPLSRVIVPILSRVREDSTRYRKVYLRSTGILMLAIVPGLIAVALTARESVLIIFGNQWLDIVPIFAWLSVGAIIQPLMVTSGWLFISLGLTKQQLRLGVMSSLWTIASIVVGLQWDAAGVAAAYAISTCIALPFRWWYLARITPIAVADYVTLQAPYLASGAATMAVLSIVSFATDLSTVSRVVVALLLSYAFAFSINLLSPTGQLAITEIIVQLRAILISRRQKRRLNSSRDQS